MTDLPALVDETAIVAAVTEWVGIVEQKMTAAASRVPT